MSTKAAITIAIRLRCGFDSALIRLRRSYQNYDSTSIRLRFDYHKNEPVHFFVVSRGVVANKKALGWTYNDVIG